jgi:FkbM family methyltransferase
MTTVGQLPRRVVRFVFRDRVMAIRGEGGRRFHFRPAEHPGFLRGTRRVEAEILRQWRAMLGENEIIFDVGANIGFTAQRFHALQGGRCRLWAFEPLPRNAAVLRLNAAELGADVAVVEAAVGNRAGDVEFEDNVEHGSLSRLADVDRRDSGDGMWDRHRRIVVPMITLDGFCEQTPGARPTFLKLDVEGAGHWALDGARRMLAACRPVISCSYHSREEGDGVAAIARELGYREVAVGPAGELSWTDRTRWGNFIHPDSPAAGRVGRVG